MKKINLYIHGRKTAAFRPRRERGRSVFRPRERYPGFQHGWAPFIVIGLLVFFAMHAAAEIGREKRKTENDIEIYPGMEIQKVGDANILVPKGAVLHKQGDTPVILMESPDEYAAREFIKVDKRLAELEKKQAALLEEVTRLSEGLEAMTSPKISQPAPKASEAVPPSWE